ncbi:putative hydrolase/acyltransferase (alpha/beta hydrolase superfamily) protein [Dioscorea alata]|uniref:Hydrolase/acyltransferase (Alpha/beta hydrolase superfamily) protein n=1 Tax=Dioscorea alata TaxID=55571 RepID=A0ACB7V4E5_DIOAL|nr:putative hydrolase/acyltransferase (alpha/beta hydrolase superfamily) protein [Dioscorea alata]
MALLLRPLSPFPSHRLHCRVVHRKGPARAVAVVRKEEGASVVWFKHDLRIDDHPGIVAAVSQHRTVVPFYVFDPRILSGFSDEMLELLLFALEDLRRVLKEQGSDLLIGYGAAEKAVIELVKKVKATHIFAEEEVEYNVRRVVDSVHASLLDKSFSWGSPKLNIWKTPFYEIKDLKETPTSCVDFQKLQLPVTAPLASPVLPVLNTDLERGALPAYDYLKRYIVENTSQSNEIWSCLKKTSAKAILKQGQVNRTNVKTKFASGLEEVKKNYESSLILEKTQRRKSMSSLFVEGGNQVLGGTDAVLNALAAYLRYLEGTARYDWQELHQKLREAETRKGASFGVLFGPALRLGIISRRRVHHEALNYERERNGGFLSPFGYSALTVMAAVETVCSMEWYSLLALKSQICNKELYPIRIWRWNGYLIQYTAVGKKGPAVLLVHGFGAFLEHFRGNLSSMANNGHRVWALTLLGFGKSEKPNIPYTELLWAELLRDFIVDIVSEPVHLVGNSIGGYFVATVAGLWPVLAKSVVLLNTAGSVVPGYSSAQIITEAQQASGIMWLGSRLLLWYLRLRAGSILKEYYPTNSERVDDWLVNEILRASYDPGVPIVMESVVNFNLSVPLNYLVESFGGKVLIIQFSLIIQGIKDPLSKSRLRLSMFRENCSGATVRELDAGHCPHDKVPEEVNSILYDWVKTTESSNYAVERV